VGAVDYCNRLVRLPKIRQPLTMIVRLPHPSVGEGISRLSGKVKKIFFADIGCWCFNGVDGAIARINNDTASHFRKTRRTP